MSSITYIALLRGINVSGHKPLPMAALRDSLSGLGFEDIQTYIQSGNAVFKAAKQNDAGIAAKIEKQLLRDFGFEVPVLVKTSPELRTAVSKNPFSRLPRVDESKLHLTFLSGVPEKSAISRLTEFCEGLKKGKSAFSEEARLHASVVYLHCPGGYGNSKLSNTVLERLLAVRATTRNWKTVNKLLEMC